MCTILHVWLFLSWATTTAKLIFWWVLVRQWQSSYLILWDCILNEWMLWLQLYYLCLWLVWYLVLLLCHWAALRRDRLASLNNSTYSQLWYLLVNLDGPFGYFSTSCHSSELYSLNLPIECSKVGIQRVFRYEFDWFYSDAVAEWIFPFVRFVRIY
jgi:hypothetical protein